MESRILGWNDNGLVDTDDVRRAPDDLDDAAPDCPYCGGLVHELGTLGRVRWWRCRACGIESCQRTAD